MTHYKNFIYIITCSNIFHVEIDKQQSHIYHARTNNRYHAYTPRIYFKYVRRISRGHYKHINLNISIEIFGSEHSWNISYIKHIKHLEHRQYAKVNDLLSKRKKWNNITSCMNRWRMNSCVFELPRKVREKVYKVHARKHI